jgi:hypothetical protein
MTAGRCLCGTVRYEIDGPLKAMLHCHCSMCRKHHGTAFATWVVAPLAGFRMVSGDEAVVRYASSPGFHRSFCKVCGSVVPEAVPDRGIVVAPAGNLEGDLGMTPQFHMFTASKAAWYAIEDDLPQFDEYPPQIGMPATPRSVVATQPGVIQGSCLCGEVAYAVTGEPMRMYYCHCSRCRLGRSAAHAANVFFRLEDFAWSRGEALVTDFALPGAQFFGTAFCSRCGSALPRVSAERKVVSVPAGSLDSEPGIAPMAHIYVDSKAPWDLIAGDVPQFAAMPTRK